MACEKCWGDAYLRMLTNGRDQAVNYREILEERKDNPCCQHPEWKPRGDFELGGDRTEVECTTCGTVGERDDKTGTVFYPAT